MIAPRYPVLAAGPALRRLGGGIALAWMAAAPALAQIVPPSDPLRGGDGAIPVPLIDPDSAGVATDGVDESERLLERLRHGGERGTHVAPGLPGTGLLGGFGGVAEVPAVPPVVTSLSPLHPVLGQGWRDGSVMRVDGERRELDFTLFLTEPERVRALRLATASSINVLPERSRFRVLVNGTPLGTAQLEQVNAPTAQDLPVAPGQLRAGVNTIRVEIDHHHRIFCGPEASFGLWTDIDLAQSGAVIEGAEGRPSAEAFVAGLAAASATGAGYEIRNAATLGPRRDEILAMLTGRIAGAVAGEAVPFRMNGPWTVAGDRPAAARVTFLTGAAPGLRFLRGGDGAQVMAITLPPEPALSDLPELEQLLPRLPAHAPLPVMNRLGPVPLAELGFRSIELHGRYALEHARFRLPDDYVVMNNLKATLNLTYAFAPGLPDRSMLQIHINGTNVRLLPIWDGGGEVIENYPIQFPAHHLRAGVNTIGFEMIVPGSPPDLPCPPRLGPVAAVADSSTLTVPYSPSMYLPDMHTAFSALQPDGVRVSDLARDQFSARDVLLLRAALRNGRSSALFQMPARLHLIPLEDLGAVPAGNYRIDRTMLATVLAPPAAPRGPDDPDAPELLGTLSPLRGAQPAILTAGWEWVTESFQSALQWMHPRSGDFLAEWLAEQNGQAVLLQLDPTLASNLWMIRAPDADPDHIVAAIAQARASGEGPRGQVSVLDHQGRWQNWYAPDRQPVLMERLSLSNARHAIGNYVSATPILFVTLLFLLALISAVFALRLVLSTRETPQ